jgi:two-component system, OmpR family, phosphate regulon response regulator PhoB
MQTVEQTTVAERPVPHSIIVVDDVGDTLEPLRLLLSDAGFAVRVASSGTEALALVAEQVPDVLILDVLMPDISGADVCRRLRAREQTRGILCIAYTGYQPATVSGSHLFDQVVLKPADFPELLEVIQTLLASRFQSS